MPLGCWAPGRGASTEGPPRCCGDDIGREVAEHKPQRHPACLVDNMGGRAITRQPTRRGAPLVARLGHALPPCCPRSLPALHPGPPPHPARPLPPVPSTLPPVFGHWLGDVAGGEGGVQQIVHRAGGVCTDGTEHACVGRKEPLSPVCKMEVHFSAAQSPVNSGEKVAVRSARCAAAPGSAGCAGCTSPSAPCPSSLTARTRPAMAATGCCRGAAWESRGAGGMKGELRRRRRRRDHRRRWRWRQDPRQRASDRGVHVCGSRRKAGSRSPSCRSFSPCCTPLGKAQGCERRNRTCKGLWKLQGGLQLKCQRQGSADTCRRLKGGLQALARAPAGSQGTQSCQLTARAELGPVGWAAAQRAARWYQSKAVQASSALTHCC